LSGKIKGTGLKGTSLPAGREGNGTRHKKGTRPQPTKRAQEEQG